MLRKVGAVLLCILLLVFIFANPLNQKALAIAVSVAVIAAVLAVMAACGITLVCADLSGSDLQQWVSDKLEEWAAARGDSLSNLLPSSMVYTTISGLFCLTAAGSQNVNDFIGWLQSDLDLQDNDSMEVISGGLQQLPLYVSDVKNDFEKVWENPNTDWLYVASYYNNAYLVYCNNDCPTESFAFYGFYVISDNSMMQVRCCTRSSQGRDYYYNPSSTDYHTFSGTSVRFVRVSNKSYNSYTNTAIPRFNDLYEAVSSLSQPQSGSLTLDTAVVTIPTVNQDEKYFIDVGAEPGVTVEEAAEGILEDVLANDLDVTAEVSDEAPSFEITGPEQILGLEQVFPFCIPFDLYNFVEALDATPIPPHFEIPFYIEGLVDYTFVIDLEAFNTVAQILRTMELLLFCVGLAFVTRSMIIRG